MLKVLALSVLLAAAASAWTVNLWPLSGSGSGSSAELSTLPPLQCGDALLVTPYIDGGVFAVNLTDKTLLWGKGFAEITQMAAVPASNAVIIAVADFTFAYDVSTGKQLWVSDQFSPATGIVVNGDTIIFGNQASYNAGIMTGLLGISAATGQVRFNTFKTSSIGTIVDLTGGMGGFFGSEGNFHTFSLATGKPLWTMKGSAVYPQPRFVTAGEGYVLIANSTIYGDREILILNAATGAIQHKLRAMGGVADAGTAMLLNGYLYAQSQEALQVYQLSTGYMVWALPAGGTLKFTSDYIVLSTTQGSGYTFLAANISNGDIVSSVSGLPSSPSGAFTVVGHDLVVLNLQGFVIVDIRTGALVTRNEDLPGIQGTSLLSLGNDLVWTTGTTVSGVSLD